MPQTRLVADALGVATICLVSILALLGLLCILYSFYFRTRVHSQGFFQLGYFSGPWIIRISFILLAIWWGLGEIIRLNFLRREGRVLNALNLKWQENVCKCYIVSNLGFAEPCLFLTLVFLLRASIQMTGSGTMTRKWNYKTAGYVILFCFPLFVLQLVVILIGSQHNNPNESYMSILPLYFTKTADSHKSNESTRAALCTYPLMSTIFLGLFATVLTVYLFWLGKKILGLVINKGLQKRVYTLILSVSSFFPLRVLFLGLSVLSKPEHYLFETFAFLAFLSLLCCAGVGVCMLVYFPVADSLALRNLQDDVEARRRMSEEHEDTISLIPTETRGSISFRAGQKEETLGAFVELSLFSASMYSSPPGSPQPLGWPMLPSAQAHGP
ncbi:hypothetical protein LguiA_008493 [Lonicera macranthoides]